MSKRSIFILIGILLLGLGLRLWNLDKPEGMWNDEYLTWKIASASFPFDFFKAIKTNCHAPLHYFYLKAWMHFFGSSDYMLRLSSVVPGVLSILVMYFVGVEFASGKKNDKNREFVGLACAGFCAISAFLLYFSQEVRIYSLTFLLTALTLWSSLKLYNEQKKINYLYLGISSLLLMLTHTIGFVFVFFNSVALFVFKIVKGKKKDMMRYLWTFLGVLVLILPSVPFLLEIMGKRQYLSQWWTPFTPSKVCFFFTDLLSPVVLNITDAPDFKTLLMSAGVVNIAFILFALIPSIICILCILKNFKKPKRGHFYLLGVFLCVFLTSLIAALTGKLVFLTKYSIEVYPVLILLIASGLSSFKSKGVRIALSTVFVVLSLFYTCVSNASAIRLVREEGHRLPIVAMNQYGFKKNDKVLFTYYPVDRFLKYGQEGQFDYAFSIDKQNFARIIKDDKASTRDALKNGKKDYRSILTADRNPRLEGILNGNIFSKIKAGEKLFIVTLSSVSIYDDYELRKVIHIEELYNRVPFLYIVTSYTTNYSLKMASEQLAFKKVLESKSWKIYVFEKA